MGGAEAPDVHRPEVLRGLAADDPLGEGLAGTARRGDAEGVEAGAHEEPSHLRRLAQDEVAVRGEGLGPVQQLTDPRLAEGGHPPPGELGEGLEVIEVRLEQLEVEARGNAVSGPG